MTRWREDATCDDWGSYVFLRDVHSDEVWSAGFQPSGREPDDYDVTFNEDRAEFVRRDGTLTTTLEVLVSAEDDAEVRRVSITNNGTARARNRDHLLCRTGAGAAGGGCRASGLLQTVRRDRISAPMSARFSPRGAGASPAEPEIWVGHLAVVDGRSPRQDRSRNRPRALPRPRPRASARRSR